MALPASFSTIQVTGSYIDLAGAPVTGTVTFSPPDDAFLKATDVDVVIAPKALVATLDEQGKFTITLPVTDDSNIVPSFTYKVEEALGTLRRTSNVEIPSALLPGPVDLSDLLPVGVLVFGSTALTRYVADALYGTVDSINGIAPAEGTSNVVLVASDVGADASGAAAAAQAAAEAYAVQRANHTGTQSLDTTTDTGTRVAMTPAERTKLTGIATQATKNQTDAYLLSRANHTGTESLDVTTDSGTRVAMTPAERTKLTGVATGATANQTDAYLLSRGNHTGTESLDVTTDSGTRVAMQPAERTKLTGIATGATKNATDAQLRDRSTHTGTQLAATISDFTTAVKAVGITPILVIDNGASVPGGTAAGTIVFQKTA
jgi:hypothetical protein